MELPTPSRIGSSATAPNDSGRPVSPNTATVASVPASAAAGGQSRCRIRTPAGTTRKRSATASATSPASSGSSAVTRRASPAVTAGTPLTVTWPTARPERATAARTSATSRWSPAWSRPSRGRIEIATVSGFGTTKLHCGRTIPVSESKTTARTKPALYSVGMPAGRPRTSRLPYLRSNFATAASAAALASAADFPFLRASASVVRRRPSRLPPIWARRFCADAATWLTTVAGPYTAATFAVRASVPSSASRRNSWS